MKPIKNIDKIVFFLSFFFFFLTANAQSPQKMSYQAVIRNASNNLVANSTVGMQISILQGSASGTIVYVETQTPTTNINGLVTLEIGTGTVISGTFATINWANGPYFIKTETDPSGGTSYSIVGTSEFLSVPYALYSLNGTPGPQGIQGVPGILPNGTTAGNTTFWNGTSWVTNNSNLFNNGDNVGVGTNNPLLKLHINGDVNNGLGTLISNTSNGTNAFSVLSLVNNGVNGAHLFLNSTTRNTDGGMNTATLRNDAGNLRLQAAGSVGLTILASSGKVGVNNSTPTEELDVTGKTKTSLFQMTSGSGTGKILTSDAIGNASWQNNTIPVGTVAGQMLYWNGTTWLTVSPGVQDQTLTFCNGKPTWGPCPPVLTIGQNYMGGNIAYIDASGQHGLIAGPISNTFSAPWGCEGTVTGAVSNSGATNTNTIIAGCSVVTAAKVCYDLVSGGYDDWYLPSKEEMLLIYPNKAALGFQDMAYWTSSESSNTQAWYFQMFNSAQGTYYKGSDFPFRPVRSF
jgi:hypothetical protein